MVNTTSLGLDGASINKDGDTTSLGLDGAGVNKDGDTNAQGLSVLVKKCMVTPLL